MIDTGPAAEGAAARRIFLECTSTYASRYNTGIQRAVRNLVRASLRTPGPWRCTAVVYNGRYLEPLAGFAPHPGENDLRRQRRTVGDRLRLAFHRVRGGAIRLLPATRLRDALHSQQLEYALRRVVYAANNGKRWITSFLRRRAPRIDYRPDDILVLLDSTWTMNLGAELRRARDAGAAIWVVVNDLIPLEHPDLAPEGTPILLDKWLRRTLPLATGLLGISRAVADSLRAHLAREYAGSGERKRPTVDHFYLGAGLDGVYQGTAALDRVSTLFDERHAPIYLVVGTIEPRKNHAQVLNVFERRWSEGSEATLLIMGRLGWRSDDLARRIRTHAQFGKRLVWFDDASDAELDHAYRRASALIFASRCEGFGLPLVEAMQYGLPVLASDIAVFREIGADYPAYFDAADERSLDEAIGQFEAASKRTQSAQRRARSWLSWSESARTLLDTVSATPHRR